MTLDGYACSVKPSNPVNQLPSPLPFMQAVPAFLDVNVSHPTHVWKNFFIHIATISVELLIAIGLKQGVELLHHRHQAARLEEDMRGQPAQNLRIMDEDFGEGDFFGMKLLLCWTGFGN
jgi:hypothetical protein